MTIHQKLLCFFFGCVVATGFTTVSASATPLPSGIYCDGYTYPEIETPYDVVDAKEANRLAHKNRAGQKDIHQCCVTRGDQ